MTRLYAVGPGIGKNRQYLVLPAQEHCRVHRPIHPPTQLSLNSYRRRCSLPRPRHKLRRFSERGAEGQDLGCGTALLVGCWAPRGVASGMALERSRPGQPHVEGGEGEVSGGRPGPGPFSSIGCRGQQACRLKPNLPAWHDPEVTPPRMGRGVPLCPRALPQSPPRLPRISLDSELVYVNMWLLRH